MSKELEALRNFISECENDWKTQPKRWVDGAINSNVSKYMYSLKSILTPPTADQVCNELKKYTGCEIEYKDNSFIATVPLPNRHRQVIVKKQRNTNNIKFYDKNIPRHLTQIDYLPPHLITLIGRFYEGEIK